MPQQLDLLEPRQLTITPAAGLTGPRLWVRRLVIWREPGGEVIRDIILRPGLNIIWSPDGRDGGSQADGQKNMGHGSGKTLFCRLIRYCLGEDRFAKEADRDKIGRAFPDGLVGAEVMLDGVCWAVVRPLGNRRRHMAVENGNLDELAAGDGAATGMAPLVAAIDRSILTPTLASLVRTQANEPAWPIALAWLARDQECRFDNVLEWRSAATGSDSPLPASGRERGPRLVALRAFLMAITEEEQEAARAVSTLDDQRREADQDVGHLLWDVRRTEKRLLAALGLTDQPVSDVPLLIAVMRNAAADNLAAASKLPAGDKAQLAAAREALEVARKELSWLEQAFSRVDAILPVEEDVLRRIRAEIPGLSYTTAEAEQPFCPICEVPIDLVLAGKCNLSHKLHDAEVCRARLERQKTDADDQLTKIDGLKAERSKLLPELALAKQAQEQADRHVVALQNSRDARETAWYAAQRLMDGVVGLAEKIDVLDAAKQTQRDRGQRVSADRDRLASFREEQSRIFGLLSDKFDPIVRYLIGQDARGRVDLSGNGIDIMIDIGGDRSTAAIESLKVLAFDLSCLCLSIEGATRVPAFFVHDSPREADLGLSIYDELFRLARDLEQHSEQPMFQYIVTTTTRPPEDLNRDPWLRLTLRGSPGQDRLLACDL